MSMSKYNKHHKVIKYPGQKKNMSTYKKIKKNKNQVSSTQLINKTEENDNAMMCALGPLSGSQG